MPRPVSPREIDEPPEATWFKPTGIPMRDLEEVVLTFDEIEAVRLADAEGLYQEQVAEQMKVSRPTVGRILASARKKIAEALVQGKAIRMEGGTINIRDPKLGKPCCARRHLHPRKKGCSKKQFINQQEKA
ncbi:MAG: DUF134 domain-containing protein [Verrucomicrobiota bacterium]|nr:DUF134 domain-containing protein [Verrucomicrobiota bacterium]